MAVGRVRIQWDGERYGKALDEAIMDGIGEAASVLAVNMAKIQGTEGGRPIAIYSTGYIEYEPAPVGNVPGVRTGSLRRAMGFELGKGRAKVGTRLDAVGYKILRDGTRVATRPAEYGAVLDNAIPGQGLNRPWTGKTLSRSLKQMSKAATRAAQRRLARGM